LKMENRKEKKKKEKENKIMTEIYYYDNGELKNPKGEDSKKISPESLRSKISTMDIFADVNIISPRRGTVVVHKNIGTGGYLATGVDSMAWLQFNSVSKRETATTFVYNFVFD